MIKVLKYFINIKLEINRDITQYNIIRYLKYLY